MQVINVKLQDGVFVPLEPINIGEDYEAVAVIGGKRVKKTEESVLASQSKARQYFKENFPGMEISKDILELVGILRQPPGKYNELYSES